jgi:FtsH-binding integral membrane protein
MIFSLMGILILIFTITCIFITIRFFQQKEFNIPAAYVWGIRLGLVFFILFSSEGGVMVALLKHTVGGADGSEGLPIFNWSKQYGDLRIAHFIGIHALQLLPLTGFYVAKNKNQLFLYAGIYFIFTSALFVQAIKGIPLFF